MSPRGRCCSQTSAKPCGECLQSKWRKRLVLVLTAHFGVAAFTLELREIGASLLTKNLHMEITITRNCSNVANSTKSYHKNQLYTVCNRWYRAQLANKMLGPLHCNGKSSVLTLWIAAINDNRIWTQQIRLDLRYCLIVNFRGLCWKNPCGNLKRNFSEREKTDEDRYFAISSFSMQNLVQNPEISETKLTVSSSQPSLDDSSLIIVIWQTNKEKGFSITKFDEEKKENLLTLKNKQRIFWGISREDK